MVTKRFFLILVAFVAVFISTSSSLAGGTFFAPTSVSLAGDGTYCEGESATIVVNAFGDAYTADADCVDGNPNKTIAHTITIYSNTTNTTAGATIESTCSFSAGNGNDFPTECTYTIPTTTSDCGTLYYFAEVTWGNGGSGSCSIPAGSYQTAVVSVTVDCACNNNGGGGGGYNCTSVIWKEDFESYADNSLSPANNNTANGANDWSAMGGNCDADGATGFVSGNFFGVDDDGNGNKEFRINDIESLTGDCCGNDQGPNTNYWITEEIDISAYSTISIAISTRVSGNVECSTCGQGLDEFYAQYSLDGGTNWSGTFSSICGATDGYTSLDCIDVSGNSLIIRVLAGNQANDENYFFDDVIVCAADCNTVLPIELISFEGAYSEKLEGNVLKWVTSSERNNDYFSIDRSIDGKEWQQIYQREGAGNTEHSRTYSFVDNTITTGINYYRLSQTDYDGKRKFYDPISVMSSNPEDIISVFPNPAKDMLTIITDFREYEVIMSDIRGKKILSSQNASFLNIENLEPGLYIITVINELGELFSKNFVKL